MKQGPQLTTHDVQKRTDSIGKGRKDKPSASWAAGNFKGGQISLEAFLMKRSSLQPVVLCLFLLGICTQASLAADITLFTGVQNPGKLTINNVVRDTKLGGVFGARFSGGQVIGFEQTLAYSPNFLESSRRAFTAQSNLHVGIPAGHVVPYATAGVGLITTLGDSVSAISARSLPSTMEAESSLGIWQGRWVCGLTSAAIQSRVFSARR